MKLCPKRADASHARLYQFNHPNESVVLGGLSVISPESAGAQNAAQYAVSEKYPSVETDFEVITAEMQVVAGLIYSLDVAVTIVGDETCSMQNFVVYEGYSDEYILQSNTALTSQKCPYVRKLRQCPGAFI